MLVTKDINTDPEHWNGDDLPFFYKLPGQIIKKEEEPLFKAIGYREADYRLTKYFIKDLGFEHYDNIALCESMLEFRERLRDIEKKPGKSFYYPVFCLENYPNPPYEHDLLDFVKKCDIEFDKFMSNINNPDTLLKNNLELVTKGLEAETLEDKNRYFKSLESAIEEYNRQLLFLYNQERVKRYMEGFKQAGLTREEILDIINSCFSDNSATVTGTVQNYVRRKGSS